MSDTTTETEAGATVVITHRIREGQSAAYEAWLDEIIPLAKKSAGLVNWQTVCPVPGLTSTYTFILRFDTREHLEAWINSEDRRRLIEKAQPLLATGDDFFVRSGLDFWFTPEGAKAKLPTRWKQFLVTWSAIYVLVLGVPLAVLPLIHRLGIPANRWLDTFFVTGTIVALMVWVVMPRYTKLVHRWLFS